MMKIDFSKSSALRQLTEQIEKQGVDIAPSYNEYVEIAYGIANDCGEDGREYFHRICRLDGKYEEANADKLFTNALNSGEKKSGLGTLFHYAKLKGVDVSAVQGKPVVERNGMFIGSGVSVVDSAGNISNVSNVSNVSGLNLGGKSYENLCEVDGVCDETIEGANPSKALATFPGYKWPGVLNNVFRVAMNDQQRDALLLSSITVLGTMLAPNLRVFYSHSYYNSILHVFIVGPAASGKGVVVFTRGLADPLEKERMKMSEEQRKEYAIQKERYRRQKGDDVIPEPVEPDPYMFILPGNTTSSSLLRNIQGSHCHSLIIETEADTISAANGSEHGNFHDIFRNAWDQSPLSMSRVTNRLVIKIENYFLGLVICGTPKQFKTFIPSAEDGSFSRFIIYFMRPSCEFIPQLSADGVDGRAYFKSLGCEWYEKYQSILSYGMFTLVLSKEQEEAMNAELSRLYKSAIGFSEDELAAFVKRLPINLLRMMSVVAIHRAFKSEDNEFDKTLVRDSLENRDDDTKEYKDLSIRDDDFEAVLSLASVLFDHSLHAASWLESSTITRRMNMEQKQLYESLGEEFTTQDATELFKAMFPGRPDKTVRTWLNRWSRGEGALSKRVCQGRYVKLDYKKDA